MPSLADVLALVKASFDPALADATADEAARKILADVFEEAGDLYFASKLRDPLARPVNYRKSARADAADMARHFAEEIVGQLFTAGAVSDDINNDYPDGDAYHHSTHVDHEWSLQEAAEILDQCRDNEEGDSGLWDYLDPEEAICCQAAYTYGNAVLGYWSELVGEINEEDFSGTDEEASLVDEDTEDNRAAVLARVEEIITRWEK